MALERGILSSEKAQTPQEFIYPGHTVAYYPIFMHLEGAQCLVVGCGPVGLRKAGQLLEHGALVRFVCPDDLSPDIAAHPRVTQYKRLFQPEDIDGCLLVHAASSCRLVNKTVAELCAQAGIVCAVADAPQEGSFINPMHFGRGALQLAISSGGISPALVKRLGKELEQWLDTRYTRHLRLLERLRPVLKARFASQQQRAAVFTQLAGSALQEALNQQDQMLCITLLQQALPEDVWPSIPELLYELV